jgi:hypothetical protein
MPTACYALANPGRRDRNGPVHNDRAKSTLTLWALLRPSYLHPEDIGVLGLIFQYVFRFVSAWIGVIESILDNFLSLCLFT